MHNNNANSPRKSECALPLVVNVLIGVNMPRNGVCRRVCADFQNKVFTPASGKKEYVKLNVEELEALRLCDLEGLEQEDAAGRMQVSRGRFQRILYSARKKSAEALCEAKGVLVEGGNYTIATAQCDCAKRCKVCKMKKEKALNQKDDTPHNLEHKGDNT